jgi:hypothetical protein
LQKKKLTALAGFPVAVGLAEDLIVDDFTGVAEVLEGTADDLGGTAVLDGLEDDDGLVPPEEPSARILAAACSAKATM